MKSKLFFLLVLAYLTATAQPITGYNNPWFFNQFPGGYPDSTTISRLAATNPDVIRFPMGTGSFVYATDRSAYGAATSDKNPNYAYAHVKLATAIGAQTAYVANLYQALIKPDSEAYWIEDIVKAVKILNPAYVELGNEFPIYPELNGGYRNGEPNIFQKKTYVANVTAAAGRYLKLCQKVMAAIRAAGYNPQFGVVMDQPLHTRGRTWNAAIRAWAEYDAEIFHYYSRPASKDQAKAELAKICAGACRPVWITEAGWLMGDSCQKNQGEIGTPAWTAFRPNVLQASKELGIQMVLWHQLYGSNCYSVVKK